MTQTFTKTYDLEIRTLNYAQGAIGLYKRIPHNIINLRLIEQLVRAAGSVGANYREANEALSKKDFVHRLKISRKECKESGYWLELLRGENSIFTTEFDQIIQESKELRNIFSAIIEKSKRQIIDKSQSPDSK